MQFKIFKTCGCILLLLSGVKLENATAPSASETIPDTTETPVLNDNSFEKNNDGLVEKGRCVCAVFNAEATTLNAEEPLFAHPTVEVQCDNAGQEYCNNVCIAAASRARGIGTAILCSMLGHVDQLKVSVFSKTCDAAEYLYTGITDSNPICCHGGVAISCDERKSDHQGHIC